MPRTAAYRIGRANYRESNILPFRRQGMALRGRRRACDGPHVYHTPNPLKNLQSRGDRG
jgi:hypothetical protein